MKRAGLAFLIALAALISFNGWRSRAINAAFSAADFAAMARHKKLGVRYEWIFQCAFVLSGAWAGVTAGMALSKRFSWPALGLLVLVLLLLGVWFVFAVSGVGAMGGMVG